jgi:hypothetical protein
MKGQQESLTTIVVKQNWPTPEAFVQRGPIKTELTQTGFVSYHGDQKYGAKLSDAVTCGLADQGNLNTSGSRQESWATPRGAFGGNPAEMDRKSPNTFVQAAMEERKAWSTPNAFCFQPPENTESWQKRAAMQLEKGVNLHKPVQSQVLHENEKVVGPMPPSAMKLNPRWVETLMGLPVGWVMPSCRNPITPQGDAIPSHGGGSWMTPEAQNSTGYQVSNGKKILRLGSQVMQNSASPVTIEPTNSDSSETESSLPPQHSHSELF